jgi:hypothetical protein
MAYTPRSAATTGPRAKKTPDARVRAGNSLATGRQKKGYADCTRYPPHVSSTEAPAICMCVRGPAPAHPLGAWACHASGGEEGGGEKRGAVETPNHRSPEESALRASLPAASVAHPGSTGPVAQHPKRSWQYVHSNAFDAITRVRCVGGGKARPAAAGSAAMATCPTTVGMSTARDTTEPDSSRRPRPGPIPTGRQDRAHADTGIAPLMVRRTRGWPGPIRTATRPDVLGRRRLAQRRRTDMHEEHRQA